MLIYSCIIDIEKSIKYQSQLTPVSNFIYTSCGAKLIPRAEDNLHLVSRTTYTSCKVL